MEFIVKDNAEVNINNSLKLNEIVQEGSLGILFRKAGYETLYSGKRGSEDVSEYGFKLNNSDPYEGPAIDTPENIPGISLKPYLMGKGQKPTREYIITESHNAFQINDGRYKFTIYELPENPEMLSSWYKLEKMKIINFIIVLLLMTYFGNAQSISKNSVGLIDGWEFIQQDLGGIGEVVRPTKADSPEAILRWEEVQLPHCFNATDAVNPSRNYYQGPGWYRTAVNVKNPYNSGRILLHFEGAGQKTDVYIGLDKVGSHVGGYDEWTVDITDFVDRASRNANMMEKFRGKVPPSIRCDNSRDLEMIPSDLSDFNVYGGLYRYVNLVYNIDLKVVVKDAQDEVVYKTQLSTSGNKLLHDFQLGEIEKWSPYAPVLYSLSINTTGKNGGQDFSNKFRFMEVRFEKNGRFYLNGDRLLIKGTHRHEDHAGVGAAMSEDLIRKEMKLIKKWG